MLDRGGATHFLIECGKCLESILLSFHGKHGMGRQVV